MALWTGLLTSCNPWPQLHNVDRHSGTFTPGIGPVFSSLLQACMFDALANALHIHAQTNAPTHDEQC